MKVSKGESQPEIVAAAFLILYMVLDAPFLYRSVLIVTHVASEARGTPSSSRQAGSAYRVETGWTLFSWCSF